MIIGTGTDLTDIRRMRRAMDRHGARLLAKLFSPEEREALNARSRTPDGFAAACARRFAAKEACAKALGTGFRQGITLPMIEVRMDSLGKPCLTLSGRALERLHTLVPQGMKPSLHLSLSDEVPYAMAFVVIEAL